ncbi:MAG TPA: exodeoxyribonuclease V subunit alpha, partial [Halieaceae bacterium]|nr:exodeoxyribonuclease V subunit alpha [Halieaceae bacterium]
MAISQALQEGHSCLFLPDWAGRGVAGSAAGGTLPSLDDWLQQLAALPLEPGRNTPLVLDGQRLYLRRYWQFEQNLAEALRPRLQPSPVADLERARAVLDTLFPPLTAGEPPDWQKVAAANALLQAFTVVAGGPGTGKTYTVTRLLACLITCLSTEHDLPLVIRMAAPTGKAAQRLAESIAAARIELAGLVPAAVLSAIPDSGITLHRLLGVMRNSPGFRHNASNPLQLDILVVDEASMVDLPLMTRLFQALPARCRVILLGDPDQLPSVAAGSVLADLAALAPCDYSAQRLAALAGLGVTLDAAEPGAVEADYLTTLRQSRRF